MFDGVNGGGRWAANHGPHDGSESEVYRIDRDDNSDGGWQWCPQCEVLFYGADSGGSLRRRGRARSEQRREV